MIYMKYQALFGFIEEPQSLKKCCSLQIVAGVYKRKDSPHSYRCAPEPDLGIVVELQASGGPASEHDRHSLITRAWTKIPLFDNQGALICGRFRIPMRNVPIKPFLHVSQVHRLPKVILLLQDGRR